MASDSFRRGARTHRVFARFVKWTPNAFRKVVYQDGNVRETLLLYVRDINKEITRKNRELNRD